MNYYTFLPQFHRAILDGTKTSTIRRKPKVKVGETFALRFWTGKPYASPMGVLGYAKCSLVIDITIERDCFKDICVFTRRPPKGMNMFLDHGILAHGEGFSCPTEMFAHFEKHHGLPYRGFLTRWVPVQIGCNVPEVPS
jgi:hypothetical protein